MKNWQTPVFWSLVGAIGLCLVMTVVTGLHESKEKAATVQIGNEVAVPAE